MARWQFYQTENGNDLVEKELKDLDRTQKAAIADVMEKYANGDHLSRQYESLGDGLHALRVRSGGCALRLYFGRVGQVLLAVHVLNKKSQKIPKKDLDLARDRLKDWLSRGV